MLGFKDFKAVNMNVTHSSMNITDEFYSNLNDDEINNRISSLGKDIKSNQEDQNTITLFKEFLAWRQRQEK
jgi:hypothetical protein